MNLEKRSAIADILKRAGINPGIQSRRAISIDTSDSAISWVLTTEQPVEVFDWQAYDITNEVLLVGGMSVRGGGTSVVLLDSHKSHGVNNVLGHAEGLMESTSGSFRSIDASILFAKDKKSKDTKQKVLDGHLTNGSIGYRVLDGFYVPEETVVTHEGIHYAGPVKIVTKWQLREFSLLPIGADTLAKVKQLINGE